ncbi:MAG TPA: co-chaperone GroES [Bacteroidetes bacterium]|nr:co-chaperone GroES [Bacteroidota bacterium]
MAKRKHLLVIGDRVLIQPDEGEERTEVGLYLPKWAVEKAAVQGGRVVATGPGIPLPEPGDLEDEPWKPSDAQVQYLPMQVEEGDYAIFLRKSAVEIKFEGKTYLVVPQSAVLVVVREEDEDLLDEM